MDSMSLAFRIVMALETAYEDIATADANNPVTIPPVKITAHGKVYTINISVDCAPQQQYNPAFAKLGPAPAV